VLGQIGRVLEYSPKAKPEPTGTQTARGLEISVVRAQHIYNNSRWPNPVVVKLEGVAFASGR
jgi:alpha-L-fucosidase